jgi:hypothetical protein
MMHRAPLVDAQIGHVAVRNEPKRRNQGTGRRQHGDLPAIRIVIIPMNSCLTELGSMIPKNLPA